MKRIAVLMSTYNGEKYLQEQIDSIINQKCDCDIQLIIRDDGSSDNTIEILKRNAEKGNLIYFTGANLGAGYGFLQLLIDNPDYDYYAFADQDDYWYADKLQRAVDVISSIENYALYCSNSEMCDASLVPLGRNVHRTMKYYNHERVFLGLTCAQGCTCVFNKRLAKLIQEKEMPQNTILHDSFITCLCFAVGGFFYADEWSSMKYRMHGNNVGGLLTKAQTGFMKMIISRMHYIFSIPKHSIVSQMAEIEKTYGEKIPSKNLELLQSVVVSKYILSKRLRYLLSSTIKDESFNLDVANRIKILLGNY